MMYSAGQAALKLNVGVGTIQRWRREGKFIPKCRTAGGHSRYSEEQILFAQEGVFQLPKKDNVVNSEKTADLNSIHSLF